MRGLIIPVATAAEANMLAPQHPTDAAPLLRREFSRRPGGSLTGAAATLETPHGRAAVRGELGDEALRIEVTVPEGAEAVLRLPGRDDETVGLGIHVDAVRAAQLRSRAAAAR